MVAVIGWLIAPADFGAASAALSTVYLIETFSNAGLKEATIREASIHTLVTDVGHTTSVMLSLIGMLLAAAAAVPVAHMVGSDRVVLMIIVASLMLPLNAMVAVPMGIMMRKMRAAQLTRRQVTSKVVSLSVIVIGGLNGLGAWTVILASVAVPLVSMVNIWLMMPRYPRLRWNPPVAKNMVLFGFTISAELACWNLMSRGFTLLFGTFHGLPALGAFQFAFRIVDEIANLIRLVVLRLGLSAFSSLQRTGKDIGRAFEKATQLLNTISAPTFLGLALIAPVLVPAVFGNKWDNGIPYIQIFSLSWMIAMPRILVSPVLLATGRQRLQLAYAAVSVVVVLVATLTIGRLSPLFGAFAFASRQLVAVPWGIWTMKQVLGLSIRRQVRILGPALFSAAVMGLIVELIMQLFTDKSVGMVALLGLSGAAAYLVMIVIVDAPTVKMAASMIKMPRLRKNRAE